MNAKQKDDFMKNVRNFFDGEDAKDIDWLAFVMKTNKVRVTLASKNAPKSTKLCG